MLYKSVAIALIQGATIMFQVKGGGGEGKHEGLQLHVAQNLNVVYPLYTSLKSYTSPTLVSSLV